jgi:hypothetical protein
MGIEYALINRKSKALYWLGKGPWGTLRHYESDLLASLEVLTRTLKEDVYDLDKKDSYYYGVGDVGAFLDDLAPKLHAFVQGATKEDIKLVSDSDDWIFSAKCVGFSITATVYSDDRIEELNYHLNADGRYTRDNADPVCRAWLDGHDDFF